jgi:hypothetical protein
MTVAADVLTEVLAAVARGESILGTKANKKPIASWKLHQTERATAELIDQWARTPAVTGYAVITGQISNLIVLDYDGDDGARLLERLGLDPHVRTGSGGFHVRMQHPGHYVATQNSEVTKLLQEKWHGLDIRADGGYAIEFGRSELGAYSTLRDLTALEPITRLPEELAIDLGLVLAERVNTSRAKPRRNGKVTHPGRHAHLMKIASAMAGRGEPEARILAEISRVNQADCDPPHDDQKVRELAEDIARRYGTRTHARNSTRPDDDGVDLTEPVIDALAKYQHLEDTDHVRVALAVAATSQLDDEPLWLQIVANASSGKSEDIAMLGDVTAGRLVEFTQAGLLGWAGGTSKGHPTGLLSRLGDGSHLVTITDFSTVLADSDRGRRDQLFALLRPLYDGYINRDLGSAPKLLEWSGRLTIVSGVTPHIDNFSAHTDALGPRWLYVRVPELSGEGRRKAATLSRQWASRKRQIRAQVRAGATVAVQEGRARAERVEVDNETGEEIIDGAIVCSLGRASVPRDGYGRREICGEVSREEPPRLAGMLTLLYRGLVGVGVPTAESPRIMLRAAVDSMPLTRRKVLGALADGEVLSTVEVAHRAGCDRKVARFALEELELLGAVGDAAADTEAERAERHEWHLAGEDGKLAGEVLKRVGRNVGYIPQSPPVRDDQTYTSSHPREHGAEADR